MRDDPKVELQIVWSTQEPGALSMRALNAPGRKGGAIREALKAAGFEPGDIVRVSLVCREKAGQP